MLPTRSFLRISDENSWHEERLSRSIQTEGDLGMRLFHALEGALATGREIALVLGSDSPGLPRTHIAALLESKADVTLGPTSDGGFFAIACRAVDPRMFDGVRWSTECTLDDVDRSASRCGLTVAIGPSWFDVDMETDLLHLLQMKNLPRHTAEWAHEYLNKGSAR